MATGTKRPRIGGLDDVRAIEAGRTWAEAAPAASMYGLIEQAGRLYADRPALTFLPDADPDTPPQVTTFEELHRQVVRAANLFHAAGVGPDDSVAIIAPNMPETQIALWGAETVARACPINVLLEPTHVLHLLRAARAKVLVALGPDPDLPVWQRLKPILAEAGVAATYIIGDEVPEEDGVERFADALAGQPADGLRFERVLDLDTPAALFHTGGTTGAPKLAQHLHGNQVHTSWSAACFYGLDEGDVLLNGFPLFHVAGAFVYGSSCFVAGINQVLPTRTGMRNQAFVEHAWRFVKRERVSVIGSVPTVLAMMLKIDAAEDELEPVRLMLTGGSPLPTELAAAFERAFSVPVRNILGMTECAGLVSVEPAAGPRVPGSTGIRLPFTEVRAVPLGADGPVLDETLPAGETGVIVLRGPNVGPGYTDPARNAGTFEDGWLISGDLGHVDAEGRIFVTGRAKDVIIRGAHNIDPAVIEEAVNAHPAVEMCAAVGMPDAHAGELPVAFVTLKPGQVVLPDDIAAFATPRIPEPPARPKRIFVVDDMPLTPIGKIYKPGLRRVAAERAFAAALAALAERAPGLTVRGLEQGGRVRVSITLPDPALEDEVRQRLRDYTVPYEIEG